MAEITEFLKISLTDEERNILRQAQNIFYDLDVGDYLGNTFEEITNGNGLTNFEGVGNLIEKILKN